MVMENFRFLNMIIPSLFQQYFNKKKTRIIYPSFSGRVYDIYIMKCYHFKVIIVTFHFLQQKKTTCLCTFHNYDLQRRRHPFKI